MKRILLLLFLLSFVQSPIFAQVIAISGTVYDQARNPLPGVNILLKGTSQGTISDAEGRYSIQAPADGVLVFSFIGFITQEEKIGSRSTVYVLLKEDQTELEAVTIVDIGYGSQQSKDLTIAVSSVRATDLEKTPVPSLDQALQGRMAGVQVFKNTGAPGGAVTVRIRGTASINSNQEPLYIIDGVPINNTFTGSTSLPGQNTGGQTGNEVINGLAGINMDDIEKIDVLKDAAAASIYGARAANGVVLITTKRGKPGAPKLSINISSGVQAMTKRYDLLNAQQYAAAVNEGLIRIGGSNTPFITETPYNTDWQDAIFQVAPMFNGTAQVSGGDERTRYMVSMGYFKQDGIIINSGFDRLSYRTNLDFKATEKIKVGTNLMFSLSNNNRLRNNGGANVQDAFNGNSAFGPSVLSTALVKSPNIPVYAPDGTGFSRDSLTAIQNPVALATEGDFRSRGLRIIGNGWIELTIAKGLTARSNFGVDIRDENEDFYQLPGPTAPGGPSLVTRSFRERIISTDSYLKYDLTSKNSLHSYSFLLGFGTQSSTNEGHWAGIADIPSRNLRELNGGGRLLPQYSDGDNTWGMISGYSRAIYDFKKKYYITMTLRTDGSSRFGPDRRFGFFPGFSAAWRVSNESFFSSSWMSDLKIRGSYGLAGNDQIDAFGWRASSDVLAVKYISRVGVVPINIKNEGYSWESSASGNLGIDVEFFQGRFSLTADAYWRNTTDLLLRVPLPRATGFDGAIKNVGDMENKGIEFALNAKILRKGPLNWNASFNMSFNRNKVTRLVNNTDVTSGAWGYSHVARVGLPIGSIQLYQLEDTVDPETGRRRIKDLNENGSRDAGDLQIVGNAYPQHIGGVSNEFSFGRFDGSVFLNWSYGNKILNETRGFIQDVGKSTINAVGTNLSSEALGRWTKSGDIASFPGIDYSNSDAVSLGSLPAGGVPTDQNLEDGSFLRVRAIQLGYNLPQERAEKAGLNSVRFYATINNLITFTRYSGYDPEVSHNAGAGANINVGIDSGTYPNNPKVITIGVNIGL